MATTGGVQQRIVAIARQLAIEELGEIDDSNALSWLDAVESRAVEIGDALVRELIRIKGAELPGAADESACPGCGQTGRYQGQRDRPLITRRGPTTITEPEYYCPCCRKAFFPCGGSDRR